VTTTPLLLLLAAAGANGLLTGASLDQSIKQLPARHRIGVLASARYGQAADLANGVAWYAALGVGTALLALVAADAGLAGQPSTAAAVALWVAIAATAAHSAATARAAPTNFRQRRLGADEAALTAVFDRFQRWQTIRVTLQVTALAAVLAALAVALTSSAPGADS
jgi:hypothetical protein